MVFQQASVGELRYLYTIGIHRERISSRKHQMLGAIIVFVGCGLTVHTVLLCIMICMFVA